MEILTTYGSAFGRIIKTHDGPVPQARGIGMCQEAAGTGLTQNYNREKGWGGVGVTYKEECFGLNILYFLLIHV